MAPPRRFRPGYRPVVIYLAAIVGPALVLLYLGLQSVQRQRQAVAGLRATNLRLAGERLAGEIERRVAALAETCLRDQRLGAIQVHAGRAMLPDEARALRASLEQVTLQHPIAEHFFIVESGHVRYPLLHDAPPRPLEDWLITEASDIRPTLAALFGSAETLELRDEKPADALVKYRQASELAKDDRLRALALARVARCARKLGLHALADQTFSVLIDRYGSLYDPVHRPYALAAIAEQPDSDAIRATKTHLYRDLVSGRWEMSADQVEYFAERLQPGPDALGFSPGTAYLAAFEFGRSLEAGFRPQGQMRTGEVFGYALPRGEHPYQVFYSSWAGASRASVLVGFSVNLTWVRSVLLPQLLGDIDPAQTLGASATLVAAGTVPAEPSQHIRLSNVFPFWSLQIQPSAGARADRRDLLLFVGSTLLVVGVLMMGVILLIRDVSRETALSRLRADFVSGVSHELKTPLTLIRLYAETLFEDEGFEPDERRGFYEIIMRESERLTHLIDNVLEFSRIDRREQRYHLKPGDLHAVVARTVGVYDQYLKRRGFSLHSTLSPDLPIVDFDGDAVTQALVNLLDNASKYSGEARDIGVRLHPADSTVILEVEDHGIGIPRAEHERVFEKFYRRTDSGRGGYGLGLFLVKHIMEAHRGRVELESEAGRGSRFRLVFPVDVGSEGAEAGIG